MRNDIRLWRAPGWPTCRFGGAPGWRMCAALVGLTCAALVGCGRSEPPRAEAATADAAAEVGQADAQDAPTPDPEPEPWLPIAPGFEVRQWRVSEGVQARVVRLDPQRWSLRALLARDIGGQPEEGDAPPEQRLARVSEFAAHLEAPVAINGGFFDPEHRPMGLRISQGQRLVPHRQVDWGVFYIDQQRPGLVHASDWDPQRDADFAVECGPRLVHRGAPFKLKPNYHRRTAIGHAPDGAVHLLVTLDPVDLNTLAGALARPVDAGGLGLVEALNLDGGPSTQLHLQHDNLPDPLHVPGITGVADAILAVPLP